MTTLTSSGGSMEIDEHGAQQEAEGDMQSKGLAGGSVGLIGGIILAISSVAPAYTLTATIGLIGSDDGTKIPVIFIAGFIPMFFVAFAYRELNKVTPDCGTSFTWTTKAFGPYIGWLGGWAAILAMIIVLSNLAGVGVQFGYQFVGDILNNEEISNLWTNNVVNVITCVSLLAIATAVACRGISTTERLQFVLVGFQMIVLVIFGIAAIVESSSSPTGLPFSWDWFSPAGMTLSAVIAGLSGSIFAFWGWDSALAVNEESKDSSTTPGRAAVLAVISILLTYLLVSIAVIMYAGVGTEGIGLGNEEIVDNVFGAVAEPVLGSPWYLLLFLAVIVSSAASLTTTFLPTSRTILAMATYKALPAIFAKVSPKYLTPSTATITAGIGAAAFYTFLSFISPRTLLDTIYSIGIMICFYYGLTSFACVWYFRKEAFDGFNSFLFKFLLPLLGGIGLVFVFVITLRDSFSPNYGSGAEIGGIGLVFILGVGLILFGLVIMAILRVKTPDFFKGKTLHRDTPVLIPND